MARLPHTIDFNEADFPGMGDIFRTIDAGIAAIVTSDPAFRPKPHKRRKSRGGKAGPSSGRPGRVQRAAA